MAISIRNAVIQDGSAIRKLLYELGFNHMTDDDIWRWEFYGHGMDPIIKIAYDNDRERVAGHYAMIPMKFNYNGDIFYGGKIEGSSTHEDYRGKNILKLYPEMKDVRLFKVLVQSLIEDAKKSNIDLIFGFPNEAAKRTQYESGFQAAPFEYDQFVRTYNVDALLDIKANNFNIVKKTSIHALLKAAILFRRKINESGKYVIREYDPGNDDIEELFDSFIKKQNVISIHRDNSYLKWRYIDNPIYRNRILSAFDKNGMLCGVIIFGYGDVDGCLEAKIEDIIYRCEDQDLITQLISSTIIELEKEKVDFISGMILKGRFDMMRNAYKKLGFWATTRREENFFYISDKLKRYGVDFYDVDNWYINFSFRQY